MTIPKTIGATIRAVRNRKAISQEMLAEKARLKALTLRDIENGRRTPRFLTIRKIAQALGMKPEDLVSMAGDTDTSTAEREKPTEIRASLQEDAKATTSLVRTLTAGAISGALLDQIDQDIANVSRRFVSQPLNEVYIEICNIGQLVFGLLDRNQYPQQVRHLQVAASRICGLKGHVCLDLGHYVEADSYAHAAWVYADSADHHGMKGWSRALQSLVAYWDKRYAKAAKLAADGTHHVSSGSISQRLPALHARAAAAIGNTEAATTALQKARTHSAPSDDNDDIGGVFAFPVAKLSAYAGTTLLSLGSREAIVESRKALDLYMEASAVDRSSGDVLAARLDIATGFLVAGDLDGMPKELDYVFDVAPERRTASIRKRAMGLAHRLNTPPYSTSASASQLRDALIDFSIAPQRAEFSA